MRTRPSPPLPRGDEFSGTFILVYQFWLPQTSRLSIPAVCCLFLLESPDTVVKNTTWFAYRQPNINIRLLTKLLYASAVRLLTRTIYLSRISTVNRRAAAILFEGYIIRYRNCRRPIMKN